MDKLKKAQSETDQVEKIEEAHQKISSLRIKEEQIYENLLKELDWGQDSGFWLFDFLYNAKKEQSLADYLKILQKH